MPKIYKVRTLGASQHVLTRNSPGRLRTYELDVVGTKLTAFTGSSCRVGTLARRCVRVVGVRDGALRSIRECYCERRCILWKQILTAQVVVIKQFDEGNKEHGFPYVIAAGIERYPLKVNKRMGAKKLARRSKIKPFIKVINYNHLFPTRYALELEGLKGVATNDTFKEVSQREAAKKEVKKLFEERYQSGKNRWFFTPLRVRTLVDVTYLSVLNGSHCSGSHPRLCTMFL